MDWNAVVADLGPRLLKFFCLQFPRHEAADLVQETFIRLLRKVDDGSFQSLRGNLRAYAFGIAFRIRKEALRQPRASLSAQLELIPDHSRAEQVDSGLILQKALKNLKHEEFDVISLLIEKDLGLEDIAEILEMPLGTVKSHVHRAKQNIKEFIKSSPVEMR